jgi:hypothetical protein
MMWMAALLFGFLFWFNMLRSVPLRISPETTWLTEPLTPDGRHIDYVAAFKQKLYPPEIATDENGYRLVFHHQRLPVMSPELVRKYCEELGLDPNTPPDISYRDIFSFCRDLELAEPEALADVIELIRKERGIIEGDEETVEVLGMPFSTGGIDWTDVAQRIFESDDPHKFPLTRRWVEDVSPALDLIAEAVTKPVYFVPMVSESDENGMYGMITFQDFQQSRDFARSFHLRFKYRVGVGDIDGAIDDILACYRLGRQFDRNGTTLTALVGVAIEGIAAAMPYNANLSVPAGEEQLQRLADGIRDLPPHITVEQIVESERYFALDAIQAAYIKGTGIAEILSNRISMPGSSPTRFEAAFDFAVDRLGYDWNIITRRINELLDAAMSGTGVVPTPPGWRPWNWLTLNARSHDVASVICNLVNPQNEILHMVYHRKDCCDNMKQIVIAMQIYERRNGTLPPAFSVADDVDESGDSIIDDNIIDGGNGNKSGKPMHSWRVLLLPYLGDPALAELYSQIRLDEPWDSEHNRQFHSRNIVIYRCPGAVTRDGEASYAVIVGDELLFSGEGRGRALAGFPRNMILLTERKEGVCWMQPDAEIPQHIAETNLINKGTTSVSSNHTGGANIGMRDGGTTFFSESIHDAAFVELIRGSEKSPRW